MIKLALFDIDGTLVYSLSDIHPDVVSEINRIKSRGVKVALATGRAYFSAKPIASLLGIDQPSMFFSGSYICNPASEEIVFSNPIPAVEGQKLLNRLREVGAYTELYTATEYFVDVDGDPFTDIHAPYMQKRPLVQSLDRMMQSTPILKFVVMTRRDAGEQVVRGILSEFPNFHAGISVGDAHPDILYFNITSDGASRADAFDFFLKHYQVKPEEVAAFGDAEADMTFISRAGHGVALGNAPQIVKDVARYVVGKVEDGGAAEALRILVPE